jgi:mannosyltransferase
MPVPLYTAASSHPSPWIRGTSSEARGAATLFMLAISLGALLRFANLGGQEMSADEGASWAAANTSSVGQVLQLQPLLNPGKFALHEIALHGWIRLFGDSLIAMRALSALAGTLGIIAVFFLAWELAGATHLITRYSGAKVETAETTSYLTLPAFAAVLFATNLVFIKYAQEARMYSVALLCALIQVGFFLRSLRRPRPAPLLLAALFTALAIASTFTMVLILPPEILWMAFLAVSRDPQLPHHAGFALLALGVGLTLLIPPAIVYLHARADAPALLAYAWASPPPYWAPLSMFNKATGTIAFPVMLGLALWGIAGAWRQARVALVFMLFWMLLPPIFVLGASYILRPAFVERYLLSSFVPFFLLVAFGIWNARRLPAQSVLLALVTLLALGHVNSNWRHPHDVQWREAVQAATGATRGTLVVSPPYAIDVVRYYLRDATRNRRVVAAESKFAAVAIVADSGVSPTEIARIAAVYPRLLIRLRGVIVRAH